VPIVQEAGLAPGLVWTGAENLTPTVIRSRTVQPIASSVPATLLGPPINTCVKRPEFGILPLYWNMLEDDEKFHGFF